MGIMFGPDNPKIGEGIVGVRLALPCGLHSVTSFKLRHGGT